MRTKHEKKNDGKNRDKRKQKSLLFSRFTYFCLVLSFFFFHFLSLDFYFVAAWLLLNIINNITYLTLNGDNILRVYIMLEHCSSVAQKFFFFLSFTHVDSIAVGFFFAFLQLFEAERITAAIPMRINILCACESKFNYMHIRVEVNKK